MSLACALQVASTFPADGFERGLVAVALMLALIGGLWLPRDPWVISLKLTLLIWIGSLEWSGAGHWFLPEPGVHGRNA